MKLSQEESFESQTKVEKKNHQRFFIKEKKRCAKEVAKKYHQSMKNCNFDEKKNKIFDCLISQLKLTEHSEKQSRVGLVEKEIE